MPARIYCRPDPRVRHSMTYVTMMPRGPREVDLGMDIAGLDVGTTLNLNAIKGRASLALV
jgi:hypothetical protein